MTNSRPPKPRVFLAFGILGAVFALASCSQPARKVARLDPNLPVGRIEGGTFVGQRIPIEISATDTGWEISATYPPFLLQQGYDEEGLKESQLFLYNPATKSSMQIQLVPAGPNETFSQEGVEWLAAIMSSGMDSELKEEYGQGNYRLFPGKVSPYQLTGVPFAAKNYARYEAKGETRENDWIYAFSEPFQIFILYQINRPGENEDHRAVEKILSTFRYTGFSTGR